MLRAALSALLSIGLGVAAGLGVLWLLNTGNAPGGAVGWIALVALGAGPVALAGFAYRHWFHRSAGACIAGLAVFWLGLLVLALSMPHGNPGDFFALGFIACMAPWALGYVVGQRMLRE